MNSLLSELRNGQFKHTDERVFVIGEIQTYLTKSGTDIVVYKSMGSLFVEVNNVRQSDFMAWRIKRALRKGSLK